MPEYNSAGQRLQKRKYDDMYHQQILYTPHLVEGRSEKPSPWELYFEMHGRVLVRMRDQSINRVRVRKNQGWLTPSEADRALEISRKPRRSGRVVRGCHRDPP